MKWLFCLIFFLVGTVCGQTTSLESSISSLREISVIKIEGYLTSTAGIIDFINQNFGSIVAKSFVNSLNTVVTNFSSAVKTANSRIFESLSQIQKNGNIVPSLLCPAIKNITAAVNKEFSQIEEVLTTLFSESCIILKNLCNGPLGPAIAPLIKYVIEYLEYFYKLSRCGRSQIENLTANVLRSIGHNDATNLDAMIKLLDGITSQLSTLFGALETSNTNVIEAVLNTAQTLNISG